MSLNSSSPIVPPPRLSQPPVPTQGSDDHGNTHKVSLGRRIGAIIGLPAWVFVGFMLSQAVIFAILAGLQAAGVTFSLTDAIIINSAGGAIIYALAIFIVVGLPRLIKKKFATTKEELGLKKPISWRDFAWVPIVFITYLFASGLFSYFAMQFLPFIDYNQEQETGFGGLSHSYEYILAFISLVIVAPIAEEVLFRGYLFGKLRKYAPIWLSILITSLLFAVVHFQWNVGVDVFVLSIALCLLRLWRGSLWAPIMLHMLKNGIAYYFLFINPTLLSTLGG